MLSRPGGRSRTAGNRTEDTADRESRRSGVRAVVVREQNPHGAMTLRDDETDATYNVVEYASPELRSVAGRLDRGVTVEVDLIRIGCRGNGWGVRSLAIPIE